MVLEYYYDLKSQPCRAVHLLLNLGNVEFEAKEVCLVSNEHIQPEYIKVNPLYKVPYVKDGDFILTESVAIMRYIAVKYDLAEHWYPRNDVQKHARVDEFLNWQNTGLRKPCSHLILDKMRMHIHINESLSKISHDAEKLEKHEEDVVKALKELDEHFLKGKPFIAGDEISAADLTGFCEVMQLDAVECTTFKDIQNVDEWLKRVEAKLGPAYKEPLAGLNSFKEMYISGK